MSKTLHDDKAQARVRQRYQENVHRSKAEARVEISTERATPVTDEKMPEAKDSQNAADHVEGAMNSMDAVFEELKQTVAQTVDRLRAEANETKATLGMVDQRITGRLKVSNSRLRNFIGGNGGPPIEDAEVIETTASKLLPSS
jgi:hypothetical protein